MNLGCSKENVICDELRGGGIDGLPWIRGDDGPAVESIVPGTRREEEPLRLVPSDPGE